MTSVAFNNLTQDIYRQHTPNMPLLHIHTNQATKASILALHGLYHIWHDLVHHSKDPSYLDASLNWWSQAIEDTAHHHQHAHPLLHQLGSSIAHHQIKASDLQCVLTGFRIDTHQFRYAKHRDLMTYLQHFEPLYQSHAKLLLNTSELPSTTSLWVQHVAIYGLCVALWQSVGAAIRQGRIYIPIVSDCLKSCLMKKMQSM
jgi:phytoene/squalene synthetase